MEKFNNNFKFEESYKELTNAVLVDSQTLMIQGKYYPVNKQSSKVLNDNLGMRSLQFSNQLYSHDKNLWEELRDKRDKLESVIKYKSSHYAMIIDDVVVSIIDNNTYIPTFIKIIDEYVKDESLSFFYNYKDDEFQFMMLKDNPEGDGKVGVIIRYFLSSNWINIKNVYYSPNNNIYISYQSITDKEVENDLEIILDKDTLMGSSQLVYHEYVSFESKASKTNISIEELFSYLKYDFGLRIKYTRIDPLNWLANTEYNTEVSNFIQDVLTYIYDTEMYRFINASYLKKSISFSKYSFFNYFKILSDLYMDNMININSLVNLIRSVNSNSTNYSQIKE